jgi:hypothetical protein
MLLQDMSDFHPATPKHENPQFDAGLAGLSAAELFKIRANASPEVKQRVDFELAHRRRNDHGTV